MGQLRQFGDWDYVVVAVILVLSAAVGLIYRFTGGRQKTIEEYLLAGKNMPMYLVAFSLMSSFMSAITILGVSSEHYTYGIQFFVINFAYGLFTPVAAYLFLPVFFNLQTTSAYEYLEMRFGKLTRLATSIAYSLQMILYMGVVLYAPALTLEAITGFNKTTAILSVGLVCTFYATLGGMKAVLVTDLFQSFLMFAAVITIIASAAMEVGGLGVIWKRAAQGGRTEFWNFDPDPTVRHTWWNLILGGAINYLSLYAVNQTQVQRYLTLRNLKQAQIALWVSWPILIGLSFLTSFAGLSMYAKYYDCDPVTAKYIQKPDQLMPYYVVQTLGHIPGLSGLFVAEIFSAGLSTISNALNSLAAVTLEDYMKPLYLYFKGTPLPVEVTSYRAKILTFTLGLITIAVAFLASLLGGVLQAALTIFGAVGGPILAVFSLGMFTKTAENKGAFTGLVAGLAISLWLAFAPKPPLTKLPMRTDGCNVTIPKAYFDPSYSIAPTSSTLVQNMVRSNEQEYLWIYRVSYMYNGLIGFLVSFIIGYAISFALSKTYHRGSKTIDPKLFVPPIAKRVVKWNKKILTATAGESLENLSKDV